MLMVIVVEASTMPAMVVEASSMLMMVMKEVGNAMRICWIRGQAGRLLKSRVFCGYCRSRCVINASLDGELNCSQISLMGSLR